MNTHKINIIFAYKNRAINVINLLKNSLLLQKNLIYFSCIEVEVSTNYRVRYLNPQGTIR